MVGIHRRRHLAHAQQGVGIVLRKAVLDHHSPCSQLQNTCSTVARTGAALAWRIAVCFFVTGHWCFRISKRRRYSGGTSQPSTVMGGCDVNQQLLVRLQVLALVDFAARQEVFLCAADQAVGTGDGLGKSWNAGSGRRARLRYCRSRKIVGARPHDRISRLRLWKCRPFRSLAKSELRPVAALRTGHSQRGAHPREVAPRQVELFGDLDHWRRPDQFVELFPGNHVLSHPHSQNPTRLTRRAGRFR